MNIILVIQPSELGPHFKMIDGVWHVNFPTTSTPPPPISNDARNIIQNVADGMFVDQRDRLAYTLVQENDSQKIQLFAYPADQTFEMATATLVNEIDMLAMNGQFDDIAIDEGVITFTDAQTGLTLTLNTNELQKVGSIKSSNTVTATESGGILKLSAKLDPKANNLLEVKAGGLQVSPDKIGQIFNAEMAKRDVHTQAILRDEEIGLKHVIGDQIINIPKVMLANSAGVGIALVNDPNALEQSRLNTNTLTLRISVPKNTVGNIDTASLYLPLGSEITVDWGDGSPVETFTSGSNFSPYHEYPALTKCIATFTLKGKIPRLYLSGGAIVEVVDFGNVPIDRLRFQCSNLIKVPAMLPTWVTDMTSFFLNCKSFNDPVVSTWDTSNVTNMYGCFEGAKAFNQPIGNWNLSKVTDVGSMFSGATAFNQDISGWNTSNVTNMMWMFESATSFNQNLSQWCVPLISSLPSSFATNSALIAVNFPIWGTCLRGENLV